MTTVERDTVRTKAPPGPIVDTEEAIWPDPRDRTYVRLDMLRNLVRAHVAERGALPASLEDFVPPPEAAERDLSHDAWGRAIAYARSGVEYELRSAGADGVARTADDLLVTRGRGAPMRGSALPREAVSAALRAMREATGDTAALRVEEGVQDDDEGWIVTVVPAEPRRGGGGRVRVGRDRRAEVVERFQ
ncbi:MAG TPA: hypothetical protein VHG91_21195 [Longimicrobium sp.]|nr:hypothetical protein [Longimicrobium sp.]